MSCRDSLKSANPSFPEISWMTSERAFTSAIPFQNPSPTTGYTHDRFARRCSCNASIRRSSRKQEKSK